MDPWILYASGALLLVGALGARPFKRWVAKCKRRRGGVYLWRVDHHRNRARRVNGYVGETVNFYLRSKQHMGMSRFDPATGRVVKGKGPGVVMVKVPAQPWSDLNPVRKDIIKLPWWLCWKWILRPLETLVMLLTWPVYNDDKNHWNPRRIPKQLAQMQRRSRDNLAAHGMSYRVGVALDHGQRRLFQVAGVLVIILGIVGYAATR